jgi:hypothetical protein
MIAGVVIGALLATIVLVTLIAWILFRTRKKMLRSGRRGRPDPANSAEMEKRGESNLEVVEGSQGFEPGSLATVVELPAQAARQPADSSAAHAEAVPDMRQEYERAVQRRTRLQELIRLEEEEDRLSRQLQTQASVPLTELPSTEQTSPAELPP